MTKDSYKEYEVKMEKSLQVLREELAGIRAGRANPRLLDKVTVDYYGTPTPITQLLLRYLKHDRSPSSLG